MMQVRSKLGELVDRAALRDEVFELVRGHGRTRRSYPVAVIMSVGMFERLQRAAELGERTK